MLKRYISIVGLAALVAFAFSALAAGTASAKEPTWWYCAKGTASVEYENHECKTAKSGGGWIEHEMKLNTEEVPFVSKHKAGATKRLVVPALGVEVECPEETDSGNLIGGVPGTDSITSDVFTGCVATKPANSALEPECVVRSSGKAVGSKEIALSAPLPSRLAWKLKEGTEAEEKEALDLLEGKGTEKVFVELVFENAVGKTCPFPVSGTHKVTGEVLAQAFGLGKTPVNEMNTVGEPVFPGCGSGTVLKEYWTGDPPNRVKHTIEGLKVSGFEAQFCETKEVELSGAFAKWGFDIRPEGNML